MFLGVHVKYLLFLPDFNETWIFFDRFSKNFECKIPVGAELFHADGQTDATEVIVPFRNFADAPRNR